MRVEMGFSDMELGDVGCHVDAGAVAEQRARGLAEGHKGVRRRRHHLDRVGHLGLHRQEKGTGDEGTPVAVLLGFGIGVGQVAGISGLGPPRQPAVLLRRSRLALSSTPRAQPKSVGRG